jgi:hypothetical protein
MKFDPLTGLLSENLSGAGSDRKIARPEPKPLNQVEV